MQLNSLNQHAWFLVANRDRLSIKINQSITFGESQDGVLAIESRIPQERWLTLSVDPGGFLNVTDLLSGCVLESPKNWSVGKPGAIFPSGTVLALPNNELFISQDLQRGKMVQRVLVTWQEDVIVVEEAVPVLQDPLAEPMLTDIVSPSVKPNSPNGDDTSLANPTSLAASSGRGISVLQTQPAVIAILMVALALLAFALRGSYIEDIDTPMTAVLVEYHGKNLPTQNLKTQRQQEDTQNVTASVATQSFAFASDTSTPVGVEEVVAEVEQAPTVEQQLIKAQRLMDAGFIHWPGDENAAGILGTLLVQYPGNSQALAMLDEAAATTLAGALVAYEDGFHDSAIRELEEIMIFHPNYYPAVVQHLDWMQTRTSTTDKY
ncbi:MAG: hypothetical protein GXP16_13990 [Gammaproteobacteria bacterium]|nr:hypothetical protein [Gammaproteobacteria bacterium]